MRNHANEARLMSSLRTTRWDSITFSHRVSNSLSRTKEALENARVEQELAEMREFRAQPFHFTRERIDPFYVPDPQDETVYGHGGRPRDRSPNKPPPVRVRTGGGFLLFRPEDEEAWHASQKQLMEQAAARRSSSGARRQQQGSRQVSPSPRELSPPPRGAPSPSYHEHAHQQPQRSRGASPPPTLHSSSTGGTTNLEGQPSRRGSTTGMPPPTAPLERHPGRRGSSTGEPNPVAPLEKQPSRRGSTSGMPPPTAPLERQPSRRGSSTGEPNSSTLVQRSDPNSEVKYVGQVNARSVGTIADLNGHRALPEKERETTLPEANLTLVRQTSQGHVAEMQQVQRDVIQASPLPVHITREPSIRAVHPSPPLQPEDKSASERSLPATGGRGEEAGAGSRSKRTSGSGRELAPKMDPMAMLNASDDES